MSKIKKNAASKYFCKALYVNSIPACIAEFKGVLAACQASDLQMLDQQTISQEALLNAMFLYFGGLLAREKIAGLEKALRQPFDDLSRMVAEDMRKREASQDAPEGESDAPDSVSLPGGSQGKSALSPKG